MNRIRVIYCLAMVLLAISCVKEDTSFLYSGEYFIEEETSVIRNSGPVANASQIYADASVELTILAGNSCIFTLHNLIVGQPAIEFTGRTETNYCNESANKEEIVFSGNRQTEDRIVEINGIIRDTVLTQLYINETVTSDIVGKWRASSIIADFDGHMETNTTVNRTLEEFLKNSFDVDFIEFTSYGTLCSDNLSHENIMEYYLRPRKNLLNFHVNKSSSEAFLQTIDTDMLEFLRLLGFANILEQGHSISIPVYYSFAGENLILSADQSLADFYISLMRESLETIASETENMTYDEAKALLGDNFMGIAITEDNFPEYKAAVLDMISVLTCGEGQYSLSLTLSPVNN